MRKPLTLLGIVALLLLAATLALPAAAAPNVCRDLPTGDQAEGAVITVSLAVTDVNGVNWNLVDETIPPGLTVVDAGGASTTTSGHLKWSATSPSPDVTYTYTVTGSAGTYTFDGVYLVSGGDETPIDCDTGLVIGGGGPMSDPNVCRDLPTGAQVAGAEITVSLAVTDVNDVDWNLVDETIPPGLTVVDAGGASTETPGHLKWSVTTPSSDVTYTYTVTGSAGTYTFDGVYLVSGGNETPIDCDTGLVIEDEGTTTSDPNVCRDIPTGAQAGTDITVSLAVTDVNDVDWNLVDETIPPGLTVVDAGGASTETPGHLKWSVTTPSSDVTYTYTVTGSAGTYTFDGVYLVSGGNETPIDCDTGLVIGDGGSTSDPNVCRDLPTGVQAGTDITVSLAVTGVNDVNWNLVDETIPSGLTVVDAGGASTATPGHLKWSATAPSPDVTYTYTVTGSAGTYTFDGIYLVSGGNETPINCDTGLVIGGGPADPNVCRDIPTGALEGAEIAVSLAVTNVNGVNWNLVDETIPSGLTVVDAGGASTATPGHLKWSATAPSPDVTYTYTVTGSAGTYTFDGIYLVSGGNETPINCDTGLEITQNNPPTAIVTFPVDGTVSGSIDVTADANDDLDPDGSVTQVEFFLIPDGSSIGTDTNGADGWGVSLDTTTVADGDYQIKAVATDDEGATGDNTGGVFTIDNSCPCDFCLELDAGWNLVSIPRMLDNQTNAKVAFNLSSTELCEYYDGCTGSWSTAAPSDMVIMPGRGYMVSKASAETLCLNFDDRGTAIPPSQQLCKDNWNMIGFPSLDSMSVADFGTVAALNGEFTMVWQWNSGWECVSPPDSNNMVPGKGYIIWMTNDGVLPGMLCLG